MQEFGPLPFVFCYLYFIRETCYIKIQKFSPPGGRMEMVNTKKSANQKESVAAPLPRTLQIGGKALAAYAAVFGAFHMLLTVLKFYVGLDYMGLLYVDYALFLVLALGASGYALAARCRHPEAAPRKKAFAKRILHKENVLLLVLMIWFIISCLYVSNDQGGNWLLYNLPSLFDMAVSLLVLFTLAQFMPGRRTLDILCDIFIFLLTLLMTAVLAVLLTTGSFQTPVGVVAMIEGRLNISSNPNTVGMYAGLLIMLCLYRMADVKPVLRLLYALAAVIHFIILSLSSSFSSLFSIMAGLGLAALLLTWRLLRGKKSWLRFWLSVLAMVAAMILAYLGRNLVFLVWNLLTGGENARDVSEGNLFNRLDIYRFAIKGLFFKLRIFVFGVTPVSVDSLISIVSDGKYNLYTHNQFLEVALSMGAPGLLMYTVWLAWLAIACVRVALAREDRGVSLAQRLLPVLILTQVAGNLAEGMLLFYFTLNGAFFFLVSGYVTQHARLLLEKQKVPAQKRQR